MGARVELALSRGVIEEEGRNALGRERTLSFWTPLDQTGVRTTVMILVSAEGASQIGE